MDLMQIEKGLGFRSAFYFLAESYSVPRTIREALSDNGFEIGLHGINHDVSPFYSKPNFRKNAKRINRYIHAWNVAGFRAPSMHSNLQWMHDLDIEYDASTFDVDPFEPQPDGMRTIFPFWVSGGDSDTGYVELPYTLPQDFTLFVILREQSIDLWKLKLDWLADNGGMALIITHSDYMGFTESRRRREEYPVAYYRQFLEYVKNRYCDKYWHALPREMAAFWKARYSKAWQGNSKETLNAIPRCMHSDTSRMF